MDSLEKVVPDIPQTPIAKTTVLLEVAQRATFAKFHIDDHTKKTSFPSNFFLSSVRTDDKIHPKFYFNFGERNQQKHIPSPKRVCIATL
jgi:hypothetical protein